MASWSRNIRVTAALVLLGLIAGCGGRNEVAELRRLRLSGSPDSARTMALEILSQHAARMDVWREFTYASLDLARRTDQDENGGPLQYLVEAGLICGSLYVHDQQHLDRDWHTVARLTAIEVGRRINRLTGLLASQAQTGEYWQRAEQYNIPNPNPLAPNPEEQLRQAVMQFRDESRQKLIDAAVLGRLIEILPEANPGTGAMLAGQINDAVSDWAQALKLESDFVGPVQERRRQALNDALQHAETDLNDLGYWLPRTILENGVLP